MNHTNADHFPTAILPDKMECTAKIIGTGVVSTPVRPRGGSLTLSISSGSNCLAEIFGLEFLFASPAGETRLSIISSEKRKVRVISVPKELMKRDLIINADDLGYTRGVNRAVGRCATEGLLRNATLMANGDAFEDAVAGIGKMQTTAGIPGIGVHLVLTELPPVARPESIPGLVDDRGLLPHSFSQLSAGIYLGRINRAVLFRELDEQVSKVMDYGITPTHLDSHKHVHVLPPILDVVIEIAKKYSLRWIRQPFERTLARRMIRAVDGSNKATFCKQHLTARSIEIYRPAFLRRIRLAGLRSPDHFYGISLTGIWNEAAMVKLVQELPAGLSEWMLHPGDCDAELRQHRTRLLEQREIERDLLISPVLRSLLHENSIGLKNYMDLNGRSLE